MTSFYLLLTISGIKSGKIRWDVFPPQIDLKIDTQVRVWREVVHLSSARGPGATFPFVLIPLPVSPEILQPTHCVGSVNLMSEPL